jgi:hypothetical protein
MIDTDVSYSSLSDEWKKWADEHDAVTGVDSNKVVTLTDIVTDNGTINRVRVLERGAKIRYLEIANNSYSLKWNDLAVVKCDARPKLLLSGINRCYKLKSGIDYEGQYVEELPGVTVSLLRDNGVVEVFNTFDVVKDTRVKVNPNQSLIEQSDLIDIVKLKNGGEYRGIIFERNYFGYDDEMVSDSAVVADGNVKHDYLLIQLENESTVSVNLRDIAEYRKEINGKYNPQTDIILNEDQYVVNRKDVYVVLADELNGTIKLPIESAPVVEQKADHVVSIESKFRSSREAKQFKVVKINKYLDKKTKTYYYAFTYEDIVRNEVPSADTEVSVNGTTRIDYNITQSGTYVFYNPNTNKAVAFKLK